MDEWRIKENIGKPIPWEDEIFETKRLKGVVKNGRIYLDMKSLYDKPQKCPLQIPIPKTPDEIKAFIEDIEWLFTKEATNISRHLEFKKFHKR